jgi:RimJ/RimL family protein N-acetyltransferase
MFASATRLDCAGLEGRHVRLEPLSLRHAEGLLAAATGPRDTYAYSTVPATADELRAYIETAVALAEAGAAVPFATVDRRDGSVVGSTRFAQLEHCQLPVAGAPLVQPACVEIGWTWLSPRAQRTAINTEAKLLMLAHAFERWKVLRVTLKTHEQNARSRAAIQRLGAQFDGLTVTHTPAGGTRPTVWFSLLAERWPEAKQRLQARLER